MIALLPSAAEIHTEDGYPDLTGSTDHGLDYDIESDLSIKFSSPSSTTLNDSGRGISIKIEQTMSPLCKNDSMTRSTDSGHGSRLNVPSAIRGAVGGGYSESSLEIPDKPMLVHVGRSSHTEVSSFGTFPGEAEAQRDKLAKHKEAMSAINMPFNMSDKPRKDIVFMSYSDYSDYVGKEPMSSTVQQEASPRITPLHISIESHSQTTSMPRLWSPGNQYITSPRSDGNLSSTGAVGTSNCTLGSAGTERTMSSSVSYRNSNIPDSASACGDSYSCSLPGDVDTSDTERASDTDTPRTTSTLNEEEDDWGTYVARAQANNQTEPEPEQYQDPGEALELDLHDKLKLLKLHGQDAISECTEDSSSQISSISDIGQDYMRDSRIRSVIQTRHETTAQIDLAKFESSHKYFSKFPDVVTSELSTKPSVTEAAPVSHKDNDLFISKENSQKFLKDSTAIRDVETMGSSAGKTMTSSSDVLSGHLGIQSSTVAQASVSSVHVSTDYYSHNQNVTCNTQQHTTTVNINLNDPSSTSLSMNENTNSERYLQGSCGGTVQSVIESSVMSESDELVLVQTTTLCNLDTPQPPTTKNTRSSSVPDLADIETLEFDSASNQQRLMYNLESHIEIQAPVRKWKRYKSMAYKKISAQKKKQILRRSQSEKALDEMNDDDEGPAIWRSISTYSLDRDDSNSGGDLSRPLSYECLSILQYKDGKSQDGKSQDEADANVIDTSDLQGLSHELTSHLFHGEYSDHHRLSEDRPDSYRRDISDDRPSSAADSYLSTSVYSEGMYSESSLSMPNLDEFSEDDIDNIDSVLYRNIEIMTPDPEQLDINFTSESETEAALSYDRIIQISNPEPICQSEILTRDRAWSESLLVVKVDDYTPQDTTELADDVTDHNDVFDTQIKAPHETDTSSIPGELTCFSDKSHDEKERRWSETLLVYQIDAAHDQNSNHLKSLDHTDPTDDGDGSHGSRKHRNIPDVKSDGRNKSNTTNNTSNVPDQSRQGHNQYQYSYNKDAVDGSGTQPILYDISSFSTVRAKYVILEVQDGPVGSGHEPVATHSVKTDGSEIAARTIASVESEVGAHELVSIAGIQARDIGSVTTDDIQAVSVDTIVSITNVSLQSGVIDPITNAHTESNVIDPVTNASIQSNGTDTANIQAEGIDSINIANVQSDTIGTLTTASIQAEGIEQEAMATVSFQEEGYTLEEGLSHKMSRVPFTDESSEDSDDDSESDNYSETSTIEMDMVEYENIEQNLEGLETDDGLSVGQASVIPCSSSFQKRNLKFRQLHVVEEEVESDCEGENVAEEPVQLMDTPNSSTHTSTEMFQSVPAPSTSAHTSTELIQSALAPSTSAHTPTELLLSVATPKSCAYTFTDMSESVAATNSSTDVLLSVEVPNTSSYTSTWESLSKRHPTSGILLKGSPKGGVSPKSVTVIPKGASPKIPSLERAAPRKPSSEVISHQSHAWNSQIPVLAGETVGEEADLGYDSIDDGTASVDDNIPAIDPRYESLVVLSSPKASPTSRSSVEIYAGDMSDDIIRDARITLHYGSPRQCNTPNVVQVQNCSPRRHVAPTVPDLDTWQKPHRFSLVEFGVLLNSTIWSSAFDVLRSFPPSYLSSPHKESNQHYPTAGNILQNSFQGIPIEILPSDITTNNAISSYASRMVDDVFKDVSVYMCQYICEYPIKKSEYPIKKSEHGLKTHVNDFICDIFNEAASVYGLEVMTHESEIVTHESEIVTCESEIIFGESENLSQNSDDISSFDHLPSNCKSNLTETVLSASDELAVGDIPGDIDLPNIKLASATGTDPPKNPVKHGPLIGLDQPMMKFDPTPIGPDPSVVGLDPTKICSDPPATLPTHLHILSQSFVQHVLHRAIATFQQNIPQTNIPHDFCSITQQTSSKITPHTSSDSKPSSSKQSLPQNKLSSQENIARYFDSQSSQESDKLESFHERLAEIKALAEPECVSVESDIPIYLENEAQLSEEEDSSKGISSHSNGCDDEHSMGVSPVCEDSHSAVHDKSEHGEGVWTGVLGMMLSPTKLLSGGSQMFGLSPGNPHLVETCEQMLSRATMVNDYDSVSTVSSMSSQATSDVASRGRSATSGTTSTLSSIELVVDKASRADQMVPTFYSIEPTSAAVSMKKVRESFYDAGNPGVSCNTISEDQRVPSFLSPTMFEGKSTVERAQRSRSLEARWRKPPSRRGELSACQRRLKFKGQRPQSAKHTRDRTEGAELVRSRSYESLKTRQTYDL